MTFMFYCHKSQTEQTRQVLPCPDRADPFPESLAGKGREKSNGKLFVLGYPDSHSIDITRP